MHTLRTRLLLYCYFHCISPQTFKQEFTTAICIYLISVCSAQQHAPAHNDTTAVRNQPISSPLNMPIDVVCCISAYIVSPAIALQPGAIEVFFFHHGFCLRMLGIAVSNSSTHWKPTSFSLCFWFPVKVNYTLFDARFVPSSARLVTLGNHARGTGALDICAIEDGCVCVCDRVCFAGVACVVVCLGQCCM